MGRGSDARQAAAVLREWREAVEDGHLDVANRIAHANPDLFHIVDGGAEPRKEAVQ